MATLVTAILYSKGDRIIITVSLIKNKLPKLIYVLLIKIRNFWVDRFVPTTLKAEYFTFYLKMEFLLEAALHLGDSAVYKEFDQLSRLINNFFSMVFNFGRLNHIKRNLCSLSHT